MSRANPSSGATGVRSPALGSRVRESEPAGERVGRPDDGGKGALATSLVRVRVAQDFDRQGASCQGLSRERRRETCVASRHRREHTRLLRAALACVRFARVGTERLALYCGRRSI